MSTEVPVPSPVGYAIGPFILDGVRRTVWQGGVFVPLNGKTFEVLAMLITHRDRVVTKEELLKHIWPDTFVQENNLARHVSILRRLLGERPDQHGYILTVQGRGYRFVAPVVELTELPVEVTTRSADASRAEADRSPAEADEALAVESESAVHRPSPAPAVASGRVWGDHRMALGVLMGTAASLIAVLSAASFWAPGPVANPSESVLRQLTYGPDAQMTPTWAPDGRAFAYASDRDGNFDVYVQQTDDSDPVRLTSSPAQDMQPAWSPDGSWLAYRSERDGGGVYVMSPKGGPERRLADFGFNPQWSSDGSLVLLKSSEVERRGRPRAYVVKLDGQTPREIRPDVTARFWSPAFAWHPDGRVSFAGQTTSGEWKFVTASLDGVADVVSSIPDSIVESKKALGLSLGRFTWAPSGRTLYFEGRSHDASNLWSVDVDPSTLAWRGPLRRLTTGAGRDKGLTLTSDGRNLAFETATERTRIWAFRLDRRTGAVADAGQPLTTGAAGEYDAAVSHDGRQLVYRTVRDGRQELWQLSISDHTERRLLADAHAVRSVPRWSPDGASLSYLINFTRSDAKVQPEPALAVLSTTGGSERLLRSRDSRTVTPDDWSADGRSILGACRPNNRVHTAICLVPVDSDAPATVVVSDPQRGLHNARFSPDQKWITFTADGEQPATATVRVQSTSGGPVIPITDGRFLVDKARWSQDGRVIYFVSNRSGFLNIWGRRFDPAKGEAVGEAFQATRFEGPRQGLATDLNLVDFSARAGQLFVPVTERTAGIWVLEGVGR